MDVQQLRHTKVTVLGAARSGVAVSRLLQTAGARVFVSDKGEETKLAAEIAQLHANGIDVEVGAHSDRVYDCSLMVLSPGVPSSAPVVVEALKRKLRVVSEVEVASWFCRSPIIAVTGSNGKTTTTTLIGRILGDAKKKHAVAGNIGTAFSSVVLDLAETDMAVLEISSFQLDHIESFRARTAVLLNITPDHMDRYDNSMERYADSKARIFMNQIAEDTLIYSADDDWTAKTVLPARGRKIPFSTRHQMEEGAFVEEGMLVTQLDGKRTEILPTEEISIKGMHNLYNSMAAVLAGQTLGVSTASMRATLRNFKGVEHRLEFVREVHGVRYFNDSKATNVDSVWYALQAFQEPIVLLLGGRDKGNDYTKLLPLVEKHLKIIIAIGESVDKIVKAFSGSVSVERATSMEEAVAIAGRVARPGEVVMLSPACASFDWFENYEQRGSVFKELVGKL